MEEFDYSEDDQKLSVVRAVSYNPLSEVRDGLDAISWRMVAVFVDSVAQSLVFSGMPVPSQWWRRSSIRAGAGGCHRRGGQDSDLEQFVSSASCSPQLCASPQASLGPCGSGWPIDCWMGVKVLFGNLELVANESAWSLKDWWTRCFNVVKHWVVHAGRLGGIWPCDVDVLSQQINENLVSFGFFS
ncbi:hypothetical protein PV326_008654 [Microctonus aethiopoides]|nr:hypothetical protein PV326_008654 [Microctonus aethiopoides]